MLTLGNGVAMGYSRLMPPRRTKEISIRDVARAAGVSVATASRAMSKTDYPVAAGTRQQVIDAARALGFVPNAMARGLARSRSDSVGVVIPSANAYYAAMMSGIEAATHAQGLTMLLGLTNGDEGRREAYITAFLERRVDGILVCAAAHDQRPSRPPEEMPVPVVLIGQQPNAGYSIIRTDNVAAGHTAARHLWSLGHRRYAYITPDDAWYDFRDRRLGMMGFLESTGEPFSVELLDEIRGETDAYRRVSDACRNGFDATAIVASTDRHALGALAALADAGVRVPEDKAVMGFDNYITSSFLRPSLTSMSMPAMEMGRLGIEYLRQKINGSAVPQDTVLQAALVARQSTGSSHGA
ncbi:LacI family transcriptional regulator [Mesorhizobium sp. AR10]|uniref:LacI family DNA-binding transcriptional regulator n=1 Tax=Mesorhizobium sp. AR10 TaxID=2865839 RepID=UPI00215F87D8|nr:LacI family DNA-binding transcriptional regulator [Mesorhizobium sp. AR10]UVK41150.1 LacI family transcriptional regulator [Mesorhizobium sp. AR10]